MSTYFTKYLPVEGEIKNGDLYFQTYQKNQIGIAQIPKEYDNPHVCYYDGFQKVKLFLCSRDITFDNYQLNLDYSEDFLQSEYIKYSDDVSFEQWFNSNIKYIQSIAFKVIGEVSTEATWVTEGMEFNEEDIKLVNGVNVMYYTRASKSTTVIIIPPYEKYTEDILSDELQYWLDNPDQYGITSAKIVGQPFVHNIMIKVQCGHFH